MVYEGFKVYGPYTFKDGRKRVILRKGKIEKLVSYPKFLVETSRDTYLNKDETVDHIDGDFTNDSLSNLQVLSRREHVILDVKRLKPQTFTCPVCEKSFILEGSKLSNAISNRKRDKTGPFCSRSCAGRYSQRVQAGEKPLPVKCLVPSYTSKKLVMSLQEETPGVDNPNSGKP